MSFADGPKVRHILVYHNPSSQACDEYSAVRGKKPEDLPDMSNLYHSIEYAQYDYLQRGQKDAAGENMLARMSEIIEILGGAANWNETKKLIWIQHRMNARQHIESLYFFKEGDHIPGPLEYAEKVPGGPNDLPGTRA